MKKSSITKTICCGLSMMMAAGALTGCMSFKPPVPQTTAAPETTITETAEPAPAETVAEVTETSAPDETPAQDDTKTPETTSTGSVTGQKGVHEFSIDETVVYDENGVKITAVEAGYENSYSTYGIKFLIENGTDKDLNISTSEMAVNGYYVSNGLYASVAAGKKTYSWIQFFDETLASSKIDMIGTVDLWLTAYDKSSYDNLFSDAKAVTIETSDASKVKEPSWEDAALIYDEGGIIIRGVSVGDKDNYYTYVTLYIENNSGQDLEFIVNDVSVNGFMVDGYLFSPYIASGYKMIADIEIDNDSLADSSIKSIEDAELSIEARTRSFDKYAEIDVTIG